MTTEKSKNNNDPRNLPSHGSSATSFARSSLARILAVRTGGAMCRGGQNYRGTGVEQWLKAKQNEVAGTSKIRTAFYRDQHKRFNGRH
jgi:hypothetical protein